MSVKISFRNDRKKWQVTHYENGERKRPLFQSKREARVFALGLGMPSIREGDAESITIEDAIKTYRDDVSVNKSRTSRKNEKRYFNLLFHFLLAERELTFLDEIRYGDMLAFQNWLKALREYKNEPFCWSEATINRCFHSIKDFFVHWVRNGKIQSSPCQHLQNMQEEDNSRRPMTSEEFTKAFAKAPPWYKPAMMFIHITGAAPSSVERLVVSDVDHAGGVLFITRRKGAKGRWRRMPIPLTPELTALIDSQLEAFPNLGPQDQVFRAGQGEPLSAAWCSRVGNRAIDAAGLSDEVVLYCVRHKLASDLTDANVNMQIIRQLMGHANIRTTQNYAKPATESLARSLRLVRGEVGGTACHQTSPLVAND